MAGLQCPKRLWYETNRRDEVPPYDAATQAIFEQGHEVGRLARGLFPGGIEIARDQLDWAAAVLATREAVVRRVPLYEAAFVHAGAGCRVDVLVPVESDLWDLIEVKSSTSPKDEYLEDVAFQAWVLRGAGIRLRRTLLCRINSSYVRRGALDPRSLFALDDLTDPVGVKLAALSEEIVRLQRVVELKAPPEVAIGPHCSSPHGCPLVPSCWSGIPEESVFTLHRGGRRSWDLFHATVVELVGIPDAFELTDRQMIQVAAARRREPHVDRAVLDLFLAKLEFPVHYFDLESLASAVPPFDGARPYQQIPFQFSLRVVDRPDAEPRATSFLAEGSGDPRPAFLAALRLAIQPRGSIVAFNAPFEIRCVSDAAESNPSDRDWAAELKPRFVDLLEPFSSFAYYHPAQLGSASLKSVLPVLSGRGYEGLEIQEGQAAASEYLRSIQPETPAGERARIRMALLEYCGRDTEGMVEIVRALERLLA